MKPPLRKPSLPKSPWLTQASRDGGAIYLGLLRALEGAIRSGELQPGDRLPPQRQVADQLRVDLTTVTRAYGLARERGLVEGSAGRGTFVRAAAAEDDAGLIDLGMNLPPPPDGVSLKALLGETTAAVLARTDPAALMSYHPGAGALAHRIAGAQWLEPCLGPVDPEQVLVCAGAQTALVAALSHVAGPGQAVTVEPLTYPGVRNAAEQLGLTLIPCPVDADGLEPDALADLCRRRRPAALYVLPTMQNPTGGTMPLERRRAVAAVAQAHGLTIVEDDPYHRLMRQPLPALAALAPERTIHIATLSKCLSPGLRIAFMTAPAAAIAPLAQSLRALALMPAPLMAAVAATWIRDGSAEKLLAGVRREAAARRAIAARLLPQARGSDEGIHVWLDLPGRWSPSALRQAGADRGISLVTADAFAAGEPFPNGVRISLGGPGKRAALEQALMKVAALAAEAPPGRLVV